MKKYEYTVQENANMGGTKGNAELTVWLNKMGEKGWELVSILPVPGMNGEQSLFFFRRE